MKQYLDALKTIADKGNVRGDRTGTGTRSIFGLQQEYDLAAGFPLVTTKKVNLRAIIEELLWFLKGSTNNNDLLAKNVHIWDEWAITDKKELSVEERYDVLKNSITEEEFSSLRYEAPLGASDDERHAFLDTHQIPRFKSGARDGELGPIYGRQWRHWESRRQFGTTVRELSDGELIERLIKNGFALEAHALVESALKYANELNTEEAHQVLRVASAKTGGIELSSQVPYFETVIIDQIAELIKGLKEKPNSRRHIVNAWNVADLPDESIKPQANVLEGRMALAPCHALFQFYTEELSLADMLNITPPDIRKKLAASVQGEHGELLTITDQEARLRLNVWGIPLMRLSCKLCQRSSDFCIGVPYNIASYALLTMMVAQCVNMVPGMFIHTHGDAHIYAPHLEGAREQLKRTPHKLPTMKINPLIKDIDGFTIDDFELVGYEHDEPIAFKIAI